MKLLYLFLTMSVVAGLFRAGGFMLGGSLGTGGVLLSGFVAGVLTVICVAWLAARLRWIRPEQRFWTIVGGLLGLGAATIVTLALVTSPVGPLASNMMIGMGATLGTAIGRSAHVRLDA